MFKTKIMRPSADTIATVMKMERIPATGAYDTVKSTTSIMDDPSAHVLEYRSYRFVNVCFFHPKIYSGSEYFFIWW